MKLALSLSMIVAVLALAGCATTGAMNGPHAAVRHRAVHHSQHVVAPKAPATAPAPAPAVTVPTPATVQPPVAKPIPKRKRWLERFESHFHKKGK